MGLKVYFVICVDIKCRNTIQIFPVIRVVSSAPQDSPENKASLYLFEWYHNFKCIFLVAFIITLHEMLLFKPKWMDGWAGAGQQ